MRVLFEDDHLIAVSKPAGLPVEAPPQGGPSVVDALARRSRARRERPPRPVVSPDAGESGAVLLARTPEAMSAIKGPGGVKLTRVVVALVEGRLGDDLRGGTGSINEPLAQTRSGTLAVRAGKGSKRAVTHFRVLGGNGTYTLVRLRLGGTLRQQARAHLAHLGHPVAGDRRYGATSNPFGRPAVHTEEVCTTHPGTGAPLRVVDPTPAEFYRAAGLEPPARAAASGDGAGWEHVADWYARLLETGRSDLIDEVVVPSALRLLAAAPGMRVLDVACGPGHLCRALAEVGAEAVGIDASERMIALARAKGGERCVYEVADARDLPACPAVAPGSFDAAACVLALMNIEPVEPVLAGMARAVRPGGRVVVVLLHPALRSPRLTSWQWDGEGESAAQYRRVDAYLTPRAVPIVMNPGAVAAGAEPVETVTYHRPIGVYVDAMAGAGLLVDRLEEWASPRRSAPGPRAAEENRARAEIPVFLALRGVRPAGAGAGIGP